MKSVTCCKCAEQFWLADETHAVLLRNNQGFNCPWGHPLVFKPGKTEAEKLREQLEEERRQRQRAEQNVAMHADDARQAREQAEHERRRANGYKGHATRITKRAKAGVCPCCNRSFENLRRHMESKHPTFTPMSDLGPLQVIEGGKAGVA